MEKVIVASTSDLTRIISASVEAATKKAVSTVPMLSQGAKDWLTNKEAMEFLGLSKTTLQRYRASGRLPYSKIGGNIYYQYSDLIAILEENRKVEHGDG